MLAVVQVGSNFLIRNRLQSLATCAAAGKALVTFALPSGATACLAAAEPTLGRRTINLLLCRRAASSQLLKGEPVIVSRCDGLPCASSLLTSHSTLNFAEDCIGCASARADHTQALCCC